MIEFPDEYLLSEAAIDLDNYQNGRSTDLDSVKKVVGFLKKYQLKDTDKIVDNIGMHSFIHFYLPLRNAVMKDTNKTIISNTSELALEMRLLTSELEDINPDSITLSSLVSFLVDFSKEITMSKNYLRCNLSEAA